MELGDRWREVRHLMGGFGFIFWLLVLIGMTGVVWFFGSLPNTGNRTHRSTALELLEERYARGEIDREEYLQKKHDLGE